MWNKPTFLVEHDDDRFESMTQKKEEIGISPDETWCLKTNIACFLVPRLKLFKEYQLNFTGFPLDFNSKDDWINVLDKMIFAFESEFKDDFYVPEEYIKKYMKDEYDEEGHEKAFNEYLKDVNEGRELFAKYFEYLWS